MATTVVDADRGVAPRPRTPWWSRLLRALGWVLIASGVVVLLFIVYLLFWTDRLNAAAQDDLTSGFQASIATEDGLDVDPNSSALRNLANIPVETEPLPPDVDAADADDSNARDAGDAADSDGVAVSGDVGDAYALMWFERDGELVVTDDILATVEGVTLDDLSLGAGHYPDAEAPGQAGNVAFAGHRTTWGRPFHNLDLLEPGDEIHVVDRAGRHWVYDFLELEVVDPTQVEVVEDDAVPGVSHLLTLTTCNPKYSAATRLVAFGELRGAPAATVGGDAGSTEGATDGATGAVPDELATEAAGP